MAPFKQPVPLRELSVAQVSELVRHTCVRIARRHPDAHPARLAEATELGGYLRARIRPLLDEVCTHAFTEGEVLERVYGYIVQPPINTATVGNAVLEVMLATLSHPQMRTLHCRSEVMCASHFAQLPRLVKLDLGTLIAIQEPLLEVVGRHCCQLEIIAFNFRATSLYAIGRLRAIKTLRVVKDTAQRCLLGRQKYHVDFLRTMLADLPRLEHITCRCIGAVLDGLPPQGRTLALRDVREKNPTQELASIVRLCPDLERLTLGSYSKSGPRLGCDFSPLTVGPVRLASLLLSCFVFSENIEAFFVNKGRYLKTLFLRDCFELKVENVKTIGRCCPLLEKLEIGRYNGIFDDVPINHYTPSNATTERIFENLLELSCNGLGLLPLCLAHARNIKSILVIWLHLSRSVESEIRTALADLIALNPMRELQSLGLYALDIVLSKELIKYFYDLPHMRNVTLCYLKPEPEVNELMLGLKKEIVVKNLNLHLEYKFSVDSDDEGDEYYL